MRTLAGVTSGVYLLLGIWNIGRLVFDLVTTPELLQPGPQLEIVIGVVTTRCVVAMFEFFIAAALFSAWNSDSGHKSPPSVVASFFIVLAAAAPVAFLALYLIVLTVRTGRDGQRQGRSDAVADGREPPAAVAEEVNPARPSKRKKERPQTTSAPSTVQAPVPATAPPPAPQVQQVEQSAKSVETSALSGRFFIWLQSAESLAKELSQVTPDSARDMTTLRHLEIKSRVLKRHRESVATIGPASKSDAAVQLSKSSEANRQQVIAANEALVHERKRLGEFDLAEIKSSGLLANLDDCILPASFFAASAATAADSSASVKAPPKSDAPRIAKRNRNYRDDAKWAITFSRQQDAVAFLRAQLLTSDNRTIVEGVKWSPALERPMMLVQWAFGAEMNGGLDAGPANLRPKGAPPVKQDRRGSDHRLAQQLKTLTGDIGNWLTQGLQTRVEAGSFGDWGKDAHRSPFEHRGVLLLDVAPIDSLIEAAKAEHVDALMAFSLSANRNDKGKGSTTAVVQLYDVARGEKLWESKPISNVKLLAARRQGKDLAADFAEVVLQFIDDEIVLRDVPELSSAQVKKRLKAIAASLEYDPLAALVELRYLELTERVVQATARKGMTKILGAEDAERLASEDEQLRRQAIEKLLPTR